MTIPREAFVHSLRGLLRPAAPFLEDPSVSEILINGHEKIYIEKEGRLRLTDRAFDSNQDLMAFLRNLSQFVGRQLTHDRPILEARLPDGSRVEAVIPPASPDGPMVAIRRFFKETLTVDRLVDFGSLTEEAAEALRVLVASKQNVIVAGGTGSGKTSLLNVLASFARDDERVVVIEDARELQLQLPHVVQLEAQLPDRRGRGAVTIRDLFRATLRMRPDRIVVGEIRGGEALDLVQAMTSGHGGCLSTVHATYPIDTLHRLETMALMSDVQIPLRALRSQVASAVDVVVQTARLGNGARCVTHITEVLGYHDEGGYRLGDLFLRDESISSSDSAKGVLTATGRSPRCLPALQALGFQFPGIAT